MNLQNTFTTLKFFFVGKRSFWRWRGELYFIQNTIFFFEFRYIYTYSFWYRQKKLYILKNGFQFFFNCLHLSKISEPKGSFLCALAHLSGPEKWERKMLKSKPTSKFIRGKFYSIHEELYVLKLRLYSRQTFRIKCKKEKSTTLKVIEFLAL